MNVTDVAVMDRSDVHHEAGPLVEIQSELPTSTICAKSRDIAGRIGPSVCETEKGFDSRIILRADNRRGHQGLRDYIPFLLHCQPPHLADISIRDRAVT